MISPVTMFIHEHDQVLYLHALHANNRTKEKNKQKLQRLIQDGLRLDKEVGVQEKSHF
jgi:hypothetical protein